MRTTAHTFLNRHRVVIGLASCLLFAGSPFSQGATLPTGFTESAWGASIANNCTAMAFAPDGRLFVCTQNGHLRVIDAGGTLLGPDFVTLTVNSSGERGLLGVAFDPDFANNHFVYVYYTATSSTIHNRVSRFTADITLPANGNVAVVGSEFPLLNLETLVATNHNGGAIHFGPDGKLYIGVGENAVGTNSQSLSNRLGKILRINTDALDSIPSDNPTSFPGIVGSTSGLNQAIWAVGLRNPFTFTFQPGTTRMFINDVGQSTWEEINDGIAGRNYGWPTSEGADNLGANFTGPLFFYGHGASATTGCAIVGGAFYNPPILQFPASYVGKYFFADFCSGWIRVMDPSNDTASGFAGGITSPVDLQVGPDGALYYLQQFGQVTRVQATPSQAMNISTRAQIGTGDNVLIGGFIITGNVAKKVIVRGIGPSTGLPGALADPVLELHGPPPGNALIASNDNWREPVQNQTDVLATGLPPSDDHESAIVATLQPNTNYTAIVKGQNGTTGIGLAEVYDLEPGNSQLGNISGRAFVQTGNDVAIGGFIVGNNIGAAKVIVRAIGPSLQSAGISNPLANPTLELRDGNGALIRFNDDWQDDPSQAAAITASGLAPTDPLESAISTSLAPGNYTAIVAGNNPGTGIGLVEIYKLP